VGRYLVGIVGDSLLRSTHDVVELKSVSEESHDVHARLTCPLPRPLPLPPPAGTARGGAPADVPSTAVEYNQHVDHNRSRHTHTRRAGKVQRNGRENIGLRDKLGEYVLE